MEEFGKIEAVVNGRIRIRRFSQEEQAGSSRPADRFLWLALLRAESELAESDTRGLCERGGNATCRETPPFRFLKDLADPMPSPLEFLELQMGGSFQDRGRESMVFAGRQGVVRKLRPMVVSPLSGYIAPLANIIYHNRLFPDTRYTLESILVDGETYSMVLAQEYVDIRLDEHDIPVKPTPDQIREAIYSLGVGLCEYTDEEIADDGSTQTEETEESGEHLRFYNSDYYVSDLQPGRNTVIDSRTGKVRFIDPRIILNDPNGPITHVSRFGRRRESMPGQLI